MPKPKPKPKPTPKAKPTPKPPPLTARQEKFAQLAAGGMLLKDAARKAGYGTGSERSLKRNARVQARIAGLRGKVEARGEELALLTIARKRRFLAELILTPVAEIGPESWLAQEWERIEIPGRASGAKPTVKLKVKVADKLRAIELDSKLANHFAVEAAEPTGKDKDKAPEQTLKEIAERVRTVLPVMWQSVGGKR